MLPIPLPRVLYVDDDKDSREMLGVLLKLWQIETTAVGSATDAWSSIQEEHFDLYLLDAGLPDLDGFELCRRIHNFDSHTPILFFSGACSVADKRMAIEAGASGYVSKPDVHGLLTSIKQFVSHANGAAT